MLVAAVVVVVLVVVVAVVVVAAAAAAAVMVLVMAVVLAVVRNIKMILFCDLIAIVPDWPVPHRTSLSGEATARMWTSPHECPMPPAFAKGKARATKADKGMLGWDPVQRK